MVPYATKLTKRYFSVIIFLNKKYKVVTSLISYSIFREKIDAYQWYNTVLL